MPVGFRVEYLVVLLLKIMDTFRADNKIKTELQKMGRRASSFRNLHILQYKLAKTFAYQRRNGCIFNTLTSVQLQEKALGWRH